jgi:uncharacterized membrane protein
MVSILTIPDDTPLKPSINTMKEGRLVSLDALRGLIIVLMAIDHASYFIAKVHLGEFWGVALPQYQGILSFLTRWITHLCAPGFFFLMGSSMGLFAASHRKGGWTENKIMRFFIMRGLLLIILQLLVENPAWLLGTFCNVRQMIEPPGGGERVMLHFGVLYGLGSNMILFALLLRANTVFIAILSIGSILVTQWLTPGASEASVLYSPILRLLLIPGHTGGWQIFYPLIPWLGITGFGLIFGKLLLKDREKFFRYTLFIGVTFLFFFVFVRWLGGFGNFHAWNAGWIAFLNVTKYPPSLSFILLTMGINLLVLSRFAKIESTLTQIGQPLLIFGQSALFFYIVHLYLYAAIGFAFPDGTSYQRMYLFWFIGLLILYPMCWWYGKFKREKTIDSIWKFF